jgi:hypothetical protein
VFRKLVALLFLWAICVAAQQAAIRMEAGVFRVTGWQAAAQPRDGWSSVFAVYAGEGDIPPVLGQYSVENGSLAFRPRFALAPGLHIRAFFHVPGQAAIEKIFELPKAEAIVSSTRVEHVYPSTDLLPVNELKFYLYFSAPMAQGEVWRHVRLLRDDGSLVEVPFLEQELWDRENRRVTLLLDPGRIKRGLASLAEAGPALEEGQHYTLVIDGDWPDSRGVPLVEEFRKLFRVVEADRKPPQVTDWHITAPAAGVEAPLAIDFPKPLDYALLQHMLTVSGPAGPVAGTVAVDREETQWRFTPNQPWVAGDYRVVVETALEDLAGNHIGRPFDVDTFDKVTRTVTSPTVAVPFQIRVRGGVR